MASSVTVIRPPKVSNADKCKFTGRGPSIQPPGMETSLSPNRASKLPRNSTEDRICVINPSGARVNAAVRESTVTRWSFHVTRQPRCSRIFNVFSTSRRRGTPSNSATQPRTIVAVRMGSTAFFAPCMYAVPCSGFPPCMVQIPIFTPPHSKLMSYYASAGKMSLREPPGIQLC